MRASDFALADASPAFPFGIGRVESAAALRVLAEDIECGRVIIRSVRVLEGASVDDFASETLRLVMARRR